MSRPEEGRPGRTRRTLGDVVVGVVGVAGLTTAAWVVVAWVFSLSFVVLATGSMSPGMPPGTAVIVRATPAGQLRAGDVVTVHRPDTGTPVTHRVVEVAPVPGSPEQRTLTLRGDANATPDRGTYTVHEVGRAVAWVPGLGRALLWAQRPASTLMIALVAAAAICWGLWPRSTPAGRSTPVRGPAHSRTG